MRPNSLLKSAACVFFIGLLGSVSAYKINAKQNLSNLVKDIPLTFSADAPQENSFFCIAARQRYIERWAILHTTEHEDVENHSAETARIAHALGVIRRVYYGKSDIDETKLICCALYHDIQETVTSDFPSPIHHYNADVESQFDKIERSVSEDFLSLISDESIQSEYKDILIPAEKDKKIWEIVVYADKISALTQCLREKKTGNKDFEPAYNTLSKKILEIDAPEVKYFVKTFMPAFGMEIPKDYTYPEPTCEK